MINAIKSTIICTLLFSVFSIYGQTVTVVNQTTQEAIENVAIFNVEKSKFTQTNQAGIASLEQFSESDILLFQHPSYHEFSIPFNALSKNNTKISLTEKIIRFESVVISANKWEQDKSEVPNKILDISLAEVEFKNPQTAADLLEATGQVFVQKSQLGGGSPMIRGFAANRVLIVVDGVRLNNAIYRGGNLQNVISMDVNSLKGAEVVFGPGSVIYGSDAIGGVMDFHTLEPDFSPDGFKINGKTLTRLSSVNEEKTGNIQLEMAGKNVASSISYSYSDYGHLVTGNERNSKFPDFGKRASYVLRINGKDSIIINPDPNRQVFSGYNQHNLQGKLRAKISNNLRFDYGFYFSTSSNIPRYDRLIETRNGLPTNAEWYYGPQKWMMHMIKARLFQPKGIFDAGKITLAYQNVEESRHDRKFQDDVLRSRTENVDILSLNADFDKVVNAHHFFYGIEAVSNNVTSNAFTQNIETGLIGATATRYPDGGTDFYSTAAYFYYKNKLKEELILNMGFRYSYFDLKSKFENQSFFNFPFTKIKINNGAINGSLGLVYKLSPIWKFDFSISSGFRSPNLDDVGKVFDSEPGNIVVPNQDLKPEFSYNFEIGITARLHENLKLYAVGYVTFLEDAMVRRNALFNGQDSIIYDGVSSRVQALVNTGRATVYGASFNFQWQLHPNWSIISMLTFSDGEDKSENIPLRHTTPVFGQTSLSFQNEKMRIDLYSKYNGKRKFSNLPPSEQNKTHLYTTDGSLAWYTINLKASYTITDHFTINAGIDNILDKHYRPYSSGISAPGRNFSVALRTRF